MLKIRLKRIGKKHQPIYRIVITEHTQPVSGKYVEKIGLYNPFTKKIELDKDKALDWMNKGVKPTNTVAKLFAKLEIKHKMVVIKKFKAKTKAQLEAENQEAEEKKAKEQAEKAAQKEAFAKEVEEKKTESEEAKLEEQKTQEAPAEKQGPPTSDTEKSKENSAESKKESAQSKSSK